MFAKSPVRTAITKPGASALGRLYTRKMRAVGTQQQLGCCVPTARIPFFYPGLKPWAWICRPCRACSQLSDLFCRYLISLPDSNNIQCIAKAPLFRGKSGAFF